MALSSKKIILKSIDDETFEVDKAVALQMQQIKEPMEEDCADTFFPVLNVKGGILSKAANYLDIKGLSDLTCRAVAEMIKGKNIEEIKRTFNIGELTPEEEAWAFE